jgi:hypothetical protein
VLFAGELFLAGVALAVLRVVPPDAAGAFFTAVAVGAFFALAVGT